MPKLHPTALIDAGAQVADDVEVGAYSIVGADVRIGAGTRVGPHAVVTGRTTIGARNRIFQFASVGEIPQDRKYGGEPTTTTLGDDNVVREFVSIHAGTAQDRGTTAIGNGNLFLAYTHVAHDCVVGNHTTFSNNAQIAGHVTIVCGPIHVPSPISTCAPTIEYAPTSTAGASRAPAATCAVG